MQWLHISDFHTSVKNWPQAVAFQWMVKSISEILKSQTDHIDAILLAGDIAFSGKEEEYKRFESEFLRPFLLIPLFKNAKLFCVPGNHDVNCDLADPIAWDRMGARRQNAFFFRARRWTKST